MKEDKYFNVNISTTTIFKILLVLVALYLIFLLGDIIVVIFVSIILTSLINPCVDFMQKRKIPRGVSAIFIYLFLLAIFIFIIYSIVPPIINEVNEFSKSSPEYLEIVISKFSILKEYAESESILDNIKEGLFTIDSDLQNAAGGIFQTVGNFFGGIVALVLVLVITFYMVVEDNAMKKVVWSIVPEKHQPYVIQLLLRMQKKVGLWLRGQIILSIIMFVATYLGLLFLGVKYALILALMAGMAEFVPYLGPVIAAVPALIIAFIQSPLLAVFVLIFYYILQMAENHILVPKVMQKVIGLNPIIIIIVLIVGLKIGGVLGGMLAIPVATAASVFFKDIFQRRRNQES